MDNRPARAKEELSPLKLLLAFAGTGSSSSPSPNTSSLPKRIIRSIDAMAQQQSNVMRRYVDEHSGRDLLFGSVLWIFSLLNVYQFFGDGLSTGIGVHENQLRGILGFMQALKHSSMLATMREILRAFPELC